MAKSIKRAELRARWTRPTISRVEAGAAEVGAGAKTEFLTGSS